MSEYVRATVAHILWTPNAEPDPIAVELAINGHRPRLRTSEIQLVVAHLTRRGWSCAAIAKHVGANSRSVQRYRAALLREGALS